MVEPDTEPASKRRKGIALLGGLKPYRVWVDNDKCGGRQMCFSDDLTEVHRHKETGEVFREHAGRYYDGSNRPVEENRLPKKSQLELIRTESGDRRDKKICSWDAIKTYEVDEGADLSKNFYEPVAVDAVNGVYILNAAEKQRLEEQQIKLFRGAE